MQVLHEVHSNSKARGGTLFGGVGGGLPLQWFCPNGIGLVGHLCPDGDHSSLLSLSQRHCAGGCRLDLLAMDAQSGVGLITLAALVIKRKGRVDVGACPHSLVTSEVHPWRWETLISPWNHVCFGKGQCTGLLACWCYQFLASYHNGCVVCRNCLNTYWYMNREIML